MVLHLPRQTVRQGFYANLKIGFGKRLPRCELAQNARLSTRLLSLAAGPGGISALTFEAG
jgi:hypothetical protein